MKGILEMRLINENTKKVWDALEVNKGLTYQELIERTGIARSTIYDRLRELEMDGLVERSPLKNPRTRPKTLWKLTLDGQVLKLEDQ